MLEIRIHHDDTASARMAQAGAQRRLMTEVARKRHVANRRIACGRTDGRKRAVGRAVVDENDLVSALSGHRLCDRGRDGRNILGLVMGRQHDGDVRAPRGHDNSVIFCRLTAGARPVSHPDGDAM